MELFKEYLAKIEDPRIHARMVEVLGWVAENFPELSTRLGWGMPMFTHHGTFIIAFNYSKKHLQVTPEGAALTKFSAEIEHAGYAASAMLLRIPWDVPVNYALLEKLIRFNLADKAKVNTFWRKPAAEDQGGST